MLYKGATMIRVDEQGVPTIIQSWHYFVGTFCVRFMDGRFVSTAFPPENRREEIQALIDAERKWLNPKQRERMEIASGDSNAWYGEIHHAEAH